MRAGTQLTCPSTPSSEPRQACRTTTVSTVTGYKSADAVSDSLSPDSPEGRQRRALAALLDRPRYEVLPLAGTAEQVEQHVPRSLPVTVTASPRKGLEPTLELTERLARCGFSPVPHLAARLVYDERHLTEINRFRDT